MISRRALLLGSAAAALAASPARAIPSKTAVADEMVYESGPVRLVAEGSNDGVNWHKLGEIYNGYGICPDSRLRPFPLFRVRYTGGDGPQTGLSCGPVQLELEEDEDDGVG